MDWVGKIITAKKITDKTFYIVGHTDDTGAVGNNLLLSKKRAEAVIDRLKGLAVDVSRISGHGVGPFSPSANNKSEAGKSKNRRVELVSKLQ